MSLASLSSFVHSYSPNNTSPNFQNNSANLNNNPQLIQESNQEEKIKGNLSEKRNPKSFFSDCAVCGQQARCHNFGVKCCHACRMFFRRSVLSLKEFKCKSGGKCQTRKGEKCRSCRLDTCIKENLDISLIQFPESFNLKKMKDWLSKKRRELMPNNFVKPLNGQQNSMKNLHIISNKNVNIIENINNGSMPNTMPQLLPNIEKINVDIEMLLSTENKALKLRQSPNNLLLEYLFTKNLENLIESIRSESPLQFNTRYSYTRVIFLKL
uniref:Nuclear receptor domain-containing protein n=1 Tax=Meloidogyne incognita TaxID=6306 RepID=A0A914NAA4_MELIC